MLDQLNSAPLPSGVATASRPRARDVRLDFFRGLTMFIIYIAHSPGNTWISWIPAQFGWSSGAELFVLCSGIASGLAFGLSFAKTGFWLGTMRVAYRVWQVYWAHLGLCLALMFVYFTASQVSGQPLYEPQGYSLMVNDPMTAIRAMITLNYFMSYTDILPMYIVLLAGIPVIMLLRRVHPLAPIVFCVSLWLYIQAANVWFEGSGLPPLRLSSKPDGSIKWYFNPFAWQLIFYTGFAFSMKWLTMPKYQFGWLFWSCIGFILLSFVFSSWVLMYWESYWRTGIWWHRESDAWESRLWDFKLWLTFGKQTHGVNDLQILRYLHMLAVAYVVLTVINPVKNGLRSWVFAPVVLVGQQSLATFLGSTALASASALTLKIYGSSWQEQTLVNLGGFAAIICLAYVVSAFKRQPWRDKRAAVAD